MFSDAYRCPEAADIVFIIDDSLSVATTSGDIHNWYGSELGFVVSVAAGFPIDENRTHVGLVQFGDSVRTPIMLNSYSNQSGLLDAISALPINGGAVSGFVLARALNTTRETMFSTSNGARPDTAKIAIILVVGSQRYTQHVITAADETRRAGIEIFTVGVTDRVDDDLLKAVSSSPTSWHYFKVDEFAQLTTVILRLLDNVCESIRNPNGTT